MRVFLYASGSGERWARTGPGAEVETSGQMKQLLWIDDAPLIVRTIRQLLARNCIAVVVTPHEKIKWTAQHNFPNRCISHEVDFLDVGQPQLLTETIAATLPHATEGEVNVGLMADTFFSEYAIDKILAADGLHFFGRPYPSMITGNRASGELFAFSWRHPDDFELLASTCEAAKAQADADPTTRDKAGTPYGGLWQLYRGCIGVPLEAPILSGPKFTSINDFTDDFDTPENYESWLSNYRKRIILQPRFTCLTK